MVCERWCVKKLCVKDGVSKMVGDNVVCERWCVTKLGVKEGVWKIVCERCCVTKLVYERVLKEGVSKMV